MSAGLFHLIILKIKVKSKLATVVDGDQKAPFSIATTRRCRGVCYSFPWIAPLYLWYGLYIAECNASRYQVPLLKSLVWRDLGLNLGLPDHWRTLYPLANSYRLLNLLRDSFMPTILQACERNKTNTFSFVQTRKNQWQNFSDYIDARKKKKSNEWIAQISNMAKRIVWPRDLHS